MDIILFQFPAQTLRHLKQNPLSIETTNHQKDFQPMSLKIKPFSQKP
jgi:hypothetical protein